MRASSIQLIAFLAFAGAAEIRRIQKRGLAEGIDHDYGYGIAEGAIAAPASGIPIPDLEYGEIALVSSAVPAEEAPVPAELEVVAVAQESAPIYTEPVVPSQPFIIESERPAIIEQEIPVPVPIRVPTTIKRTITVAVPLRVPVPIPHNVPVPIPQPYPYIITKHVPFEVPRPYPVPLVKSVPVPVKQPYPVPVPVPIVPQQSVAVSAGASGAGYGAGSTGVVVKSH